MLDIERHVMHLMIFDYLRDYYIFIIFLYKYDQQVLRPCMFTVVNNHHRTICQLLDPTSLGLNRNTIKNYLSN